MLDNGPPVTQDNDSKRPDRGDEGLAQSQPPSNSLPKGGGAIRGSGAWNSRHDPFSTTGLVEVRTYRLCQRVLMFHHFPDEAEVGSNCLVPSTDFNSRYRPQTKFQKKLEQKSISP